MDEGGIVEAWVDHDAGNVELLVTQGLCCRAHIVFTKPNLRRKVWPIKFFASRNCQKEKIRRVNGNRDIGS